MPTANDLGADCPLCVASATGEPIPLDADRDAICAEHAAALDDLCVGLLLALRGMGQDPAAEPAPRQSA